MSEYLKILKQNPQKYERYKLMKSMSLVENMEKQWEPPSYRKKQRLKEEKK